MTLFSPKENFSLKGKHIILRPLKSSDSRSIYENVKDRDISRYTDISSTYSFKDVKEFIRQAKREVRQKIAYRLGINLGVKEEIIGVIALTNIDYRNKSAETDFWLGKRYRKRGIMSEAIQMMLWFGFKKLRLHRIFAKTLLKNIVSQKLLLRTGFQYEGTLRKCIFERGKWQDVLVYSILLEEFAV